MQQNPFPRGNINDEKISEESSILGGGSSNGDVQEEIKNEGCQKPPLAPVVKRKSMTMSMGSNGSGSGGSSLL
jgi:hypothetical protein